MRMVKSIEASRRRRLPRRIYDLLHTVLSPSGPLHQIRFLARRKEEGKKKFIGKAIRPWTSASVGNDDNDVALLPRRWTDQSQARNCVWVSRHRRSHWTNHQAASSSEFLKSLVECRPYWLNTKSAAAASFLSHPEILISFFFLSPPVKIPPYTALPWLRRRALLIRISSRP